MAVAARKRYTSADFMRFPDDGNRHEVIEGEWIMTPPPTPDHQKVVRHLLRVMDDHASRGDLGEVLSSPIGVVLSRTDAVQPDLHFLSKARLDRLKKDAIHGAPDVVVEVLSPSTAGIDRNRKLALYDKAGVREYWIVDPAGRTVEVHEFGATRRLRVFQEGQSFESAALPGLQVRVAEIFDRIR